MNQQFSRFMVGFICQSLSLQALAMQVHCETPTQGQQFDIEVDRPGTLAKPKVEFASFKSVARASSSSTISDYSFNSQRGISSLTPVRTSFSAHGGLTKIVQDGGLEYRIEIKNLSTFSETDDFISIRDSRGHEVTYPLSCK